MVKSIKDAKTFHGKFIIAILSVLAPIGVLIYIGSLLGVFVGLFLDIRISSFSFFFFLFFVPFYIIFLEMLATLGGEEAKEYLIWKLRWLGSLRRRNNDNDNDDGFSDDVNIGCPTGASAEDIIYRELFCGRHLDRD